MKRVLLLSMGLDSLPAWYLLGKPPSIFFDLGTQAAPAERQRFEWLQEDHPWEDLQGPEEDLQWLGHLERKNYFVPYRNLLLVMRAAAGHGANEVVLASVAEWAPDKRLLFTLTATAALRAAARKWWGGPKVTRPLHRWGRPKVLRKTADRMCGWHWLRYAWCCYRSGLTHCGQCASCRRAAVGLLAAGCPIMHRLVSPPRALSMTEFMRWSMGAVNRRPAPGEVFNWPRRGQELWMAWRQYKKEGWARATP